MRLSRERVNAIRAILAEDCPPILDGETWEGYVYRCRHLGETIRQAEARLLKAGATPPEPTTCTCEGDMAWNEGIPHWTRHPDPHCPEHHEEDNQ